MKIGTSIAGSLDAVARNVRTQEELGYDFVTSNELSHDSMLAMAVAATHSSRIELGTHVTIAFARPPMILAMEAWDIQKASGGRFALGLGSQVKGHNERRFSVPWSRPAAPRMKEYVRCLHAIWHTFQTGAKPDFRGQSYEFTLMTPDFNPGPLEVPPPKVFLAAVGDAMARVAGEVADGLLPHSFSSRKYIREVIVPNVKIGLERSGRSWDDFEIEGGGFVVLGADQSEIEQGLEHTRRRVAFYGSTRTYFDVWDTHGRRDLGERLHALSLEQKWDEMTSLISDDILMEFTETSTYDDLPKLVEACSDYATRVHASLPAETPADRERLAHVLDQIRKIEPRKAKTGA